MENVATEMVTMPKVKFLSRRYVRPNAVIGLYRGRLRKTKIDRDDPYEFWTCRLSGWRMNRGCSNLRLASRAPENILSFVIIEPQSKTGISTHQGIAPK